MIFLRMALTSTLSGIAINSKGESELRGREPYWSSPVTLQQ